MIVRRSKSFAWECKAFVRECKKIKNTCPTECFLGKQFLKMSPVLVIIIFLSRTSIAQKTFLSPQAFHKSYCFYQLMKQPVTLS